MATPSYLRKSYEDRKEQLGNWLFSGQRRKKLVSLDFTVICPDCFAGTAIYEKFGLQYNTPTVGLFFYPDDYIRFLEGFKECLGQPLRFKQSSRYQAQNEFRKKHPYPVGVLGDDIEIQFLHYNTEEEVAEKWARRSKRVNFGRLFFMFFDSVVVTPAHIERFAKLPFERKVFFSSKPTSYPEMTVIVEGSTANPWLHDGYFHVNEWLRFFEGHFDVVGWLNGGDFRKATDGSSSR